MPGISHDGLVEVFRQGPEVVIELLRAAAVPVPSCEVARTDTASLTELQPPEFRSDLLVLLEAQGRIQLVVIVEVQLRKDERKRFSWPAYLSVGRARHRCPAVVLVFSPSASVAAWAAEPVELGPGNVFRAVVVGPDGIPTIDDPDQARQQVELAVLSAVARGDTVAQDEVESAARIVTAALDACRALPDERAVLYSDLVLACLSQAVHEAVMSIPAGYQFQSELAQKHQELGRVEGRAEGRVEGRAESVLAVLEARGLTVNDEQRKRIEGTTDLQALDRLIRTAATVKSTDELFED